MYPSYGIEVPTVPSRCKKPPEEEFLVKFQAETFW